MRGPKGPRTPLVVQVFGSILLVTLASVLATGLLVRTALSDQFEAYLSGLPQHAGPGQGMGRMLLGAAEQSFIAQVDLWIFISAMGSIVLAIIVALLLARRIARPIVRLTSEVDEFARGDLERRVALDGPAEVGELADAFNGMADSLSQAEIMRRRLVADVAHELRNPVAALRVQLEGVAEGVIEMDEVRAASLVDDVLHLSRLVADLQELSIAEAGQLPYVLTRFDLVPMVRAEVDRMRPGMPHGVEVLVRAEGGPFPVEADEHRIAQVLRNLLSNASRHTREGSVTVRLAGTGRSVRVEVTDTGEGIAASDLPHIFDRFYRADTARASDTGGAGIGLAITRAIIEDHHGIVFARSTPGDGATVGFELPLAESQA
ncbi:MAG: sensor histidine kinase [Coriobacteriia bacterium]